MTSIPSFWSSSILPALVDTIRIPAKSPHFDPDWAESLGPWTPVIRDGGTSTHRGDDE